MPELELTPPLPLGGRRILRSVAGLLNLDHPFWVACVTPPPNNSLGALLALQTVLPSAAEVHQGEVCLKGISQSAGAFVIQRNSRYFRWRVSVDRKVPGGEWKPFGSHGDVLLIGHGGTEVLITDDADEAMKTLASVLTARDLQLRGALWN